MQSKHLTIGVLSITALILFIAHLMPIQPVMAGESVKDRSYQLITARSNQGGETVFVIDSPTGQIAVFTWDAGRRALVLKGVDSLANAFR